MPVLRTGGHILLCERGAGGFPSQGRRLCAVHPQEEGEPTREPAWPGKGGVSGRPGAHSQEGGKEIRVSACELLAGFFFVCFFFVKDGFRQ